MNGDRKIIHIDMDAFYASVEQRDNPDLRGKPVVIGSPSDRGVVATASYEARAYGIHSAMPSVTAKRRCPNLIFVKGNMEKYKEASAQIRDIFHEFTDLVEPLSLDEAYLDVTTNKVKIPSATLIAKKIKELIYERTLLTASAGVSYNKFLAKVASDINKPNGITVITPKDALEFIDKLKIEKFYGIGKVTTEKMHKMGVFFGSDLKKLSLHRLQHLFGKAGSYYYHIARGIDNRPVNPYRERKSVGGEKTFSDDKQSLPELTTALRNISERVFERIQKTQKYGRTVTLKVKYSDFTRITRSKTLPEPVNNFDILLLVATELLTNAYEPGKPVRLLGISVSNFLQEIQEYVQLKIDWDKYM